MEIIKPCQHKKKNMQEIFSVFLDYVTINMISIIPKASAI